MGRRMGSKNRLKNYAGDELLKFASKPVHALVQPFDLPPARLVQHLAPALPKPTAVVQPAAVAAYIATPAGAGTIKRVVQQPLRKAVPMTHEERVKEQVLLPQLLEMAERCAAAGFKW